MVVPNQYIPVGKAFFIMGVVSELITFKNSHRVYSSAEVTPADLRQKLRLGFYSANTIHRQLLLTVDEAALIHRDWAFDAKLSNEQLDDIFWLIGDDEFNILIINELSPI